MPRLLPLPVDDHLAAIVDAVANDRAAVVTAAPGAGKTTRVPPALLEAGPLLLLQPRRVAARAIARRIASERGWTVGREVGWQVRLDRNFTKDTRLLVATEGILTARLQEDPLAADFATIVIDEFHERSIHADVGLALAREAWRARRDLRLVVMSATIDSARVSQYLDDCPVIAVPGRLFALDVSYHPGVTVEKAVLEIASHSRGAVLCFLPGAPEIRRAAEQLSPLAAKGISVLPLHGSLGAEEQDAALQPSQTSRVILATNLAETTLTVPDVTAVIDTGLHKVARYDANRAIDSLEMERVSQDSADQRAGRAGRVQAGRVMRLWDARDRLRPHREPEIHRIDLSAAVLDVLAWGGDPQALEWFDAPRPDALSAAMALLRRLDAVDASGGITEIGRALTRLPLHPRLGRMLLASNHDPAMARACELLSERHFVPPRHGATTCDLLAVVGRAPRSEEAFRRAVLAGYPDRVARRRAESRDRFVLASGAGARLARESGVVNSEFIVAVEVAGAVTTGGEALIRMATGIEREWISVADRRIQHRFDADVGVVRAERVETYDALVVSSQPMAADPLESGRLIGDEYVRRGPRDSDRAFLRRLAFAGLDVPFEALVAAGSMGATRLADVDLERGLTADQARALRKGAPESIAVPSGREVPLEYRDGGVVVASVKLQEVFGLADSPRVGAGRIPVTFELLSPAGRPVQVTNDLRSFWKNGYPEVRRELRARYPRHPWPEDPWTATPTSRPLRRPI